MFLAIFLETTLFSEMERFKQLLAAALVQEIFTQYLVSLRVRQTMLQLSLVSLRVRQTMLQPFLAHYTITGMSALQVVPTASQPIKQLHLLVWAHRWSNTTPRPIHCRFLVLGVLVFPAVMINTFSLIIADLSVESQISLGITISTH